MKNVQITLDEATLSGVDRLRKSVRLTRSEVIRQALRQWMRRRAIDTFESQWIDALKTNPDDPRRAGEWLQAQDWTSR